ncbi:unnamed protein product [Bursaphelenchus okinawaensis]|uniref:DZF domain-containing protein n=1 Tax=Bursaphelenchus okinawaensis TaxID=465554 RepID=A0A811L9B5_9BILA|nr:unnamed protein product [Bursaphelenchus okinawaensis]CAG9120333.1 unnamed protein product [Bursaphelenchus okinawaensis]
MNNGHHYQASGSSHFFNRLKVPSLLPPKPSLAPPLLPQPILRPRKRPNPSPPVFRSVPSMVPRLLPQPTFKEREVKKFIEIRVPEVSSSRAPTFDAYLEENFFIPLSKGEQRLTEVLMEKNKQIAPAGEHYEAISSLVGEVKQALEMIVAMGMLSFLKMEEYRVVGSFKHDTMLNKSNIAEMVLIFSTTVKHDDVIKLANELVDIVKDRLTGQTFEVRKTPYGCKIQSSAATVRLLPALANEDVELEKDVHMEKGFFVRNKMALKHTYWLEDNVKNPNIRILIRLVKDVRRRAKGMQALNSWTISLLAHYCVTYTTKGTALTLSHAFRRFFSLLSSGILLHTSLSLTDPCGTGTRIDKGYSLKEADDICRTAQFVLRLLIHEKYDRMLGNKKGHMDLCAENEYDKKSLNIAPVRSAYDSEKMVNLPGPGFSSDLYRYDESQPEYKMDPPLAKSEAVSVEIPPKPLPAQNEFKEFYKSIQFINLSRPTINKPTANAMMRNALYNPY